MAKTTITLKGVPVREEALANAELYPGHLVELMSTGKIRKHATDAAYAEKAFALENELLGGEVGTAYAADALVQYGIFRSGDWVYARITGSPTKGSLLSSKGDGTLKKFEKDSAGQAVEEVALAVLLETVSGGMAAVRIL